MPSPVEAAKARFVEHASAPEWGFGLVVRENPSGRSVTVLFERAGERTLPAGLAALTPVDAHLVPDDIRSSLEARARRGALVPGAAYLGGDRQPGRPRRVMAVDRRKPPESPLPERFSRGESSDLLDRGRRIPGSFEQGKRR